MVSYFSVFIFQIPVIQKITVFFLFFCLFVLIFYFFFNLISCIQNILLIFIYIIVCNNVKIYFFQNKCFTGETNTMPSVGLIVTLFSWLSVWRRCLFLLFCCISQSAPYWWNDKLWLRRASLRTSQSDGAACVPQR